MPEAAKARPERLATPDHLAAACGVLAGVGGFVHGVGEVAQGTGAPEGIVIDSWTSGRIAANVGGEPAMTLVPDMAVTGWSAIVVALAVMAWAGWFVGRRFGGTVLALLSVVMLLVGGGFGPPALGLLSALVAGSAHRARRRGRGDRSGRRRTDFLARVWPGLFWLCLVNAAFLVVGSFAVGVVLDLSIPDAFVYSLFLAVVSMPAAAVAGAAREQEGPA